MPWAIVTPFAVCAFVKDIWNNKKNCHFNLALTTWNIPFSGYMRGVAMFGNPTDDNLKATSSHRKKWIPQHATAS
jgi:hypothetical protein